ncbi:MAG: hypothetical protein L3J35_11305 [Bacteroidales bacterium]|nr:hypothetical protein [Bacteroidales bacterium]
MKKYILILWFSVVTISVFSQSYFTAGGARFGTDWGISVQQRILKHTTFEGIFQSSLFREELMLTGILEHHFPLITRRLNIYTGAGFHKGFVTDVNSDYSSPYGLSLITGVEFTIARFVFSYDFKPAFNFSGGENYWYGQTAVSVRYVIIKQNAFKKMKRKKERRKKHNEKLKKQNQRQKNRKGIFDKN